MGTSKVSLLLPGLALAAAVGGLNTSCTEAEAEMANLLFAELDRELLNTELKKLLPRTIGQSGVVRKTLYYWRLYYQNPILVRNWTLHPITSPYPSLH